MKEISVDEQIRRRGYDSIIEPLVPDASLIDTAVYLKRLDINKKMNPIHMTTIEAALHDSEAFYTSFYKVHPVIYRKFYINTRFLKVCVSTEISPFALPVFSVYNPDEICYGCLETDLPSNPEEQIAFSGIRLNSIVTELTACSHSHEITHAEVDSVRGAISHYYDSEILSVFIELQIAELLSKGERLLRTQDSRRIHEIELLAKELRDYHKGLFGKSRDNALEDSKYVISDIKAYNLFAEYYYGTVATREYIRSRIQQIFNGNITLTELLDEFIDNPNTMDEISRLTFTPKAVKYFSR